MSSVFQLAVDELLAVNFAQSALFFFGFGLAAVPQKPLVAEGYCRSRVFDHYEAVATLSFFLVLNTFASMVMSGHVRYRLSDTAEGGLQALAPRRRRAMRSFVAVAWFLNLAASVLALATYGIILQAKLGLFECLPAATRAGVVLTYVLVGFILVIAYADNGWRLLMAAH